MYALEDVLAVLVPHRRFSAYLDSCPPAAQAYRRMLIQRISETAEGLHAQATTTGAQRLARLLITLARRHVQTGHRRITVIDPAALRRLGGLGP